jgi:hypothetical protein
MLLRTGMLPALGGAHTSWMRTRRVAGDGGAACVISLSSNVLNLQAAGTLGPHEEQDGWGADSSTFGCDRLHASKFLELVVQQFSAQRTVPYSSTPGLVGREALGGRALLGQLRRRSLVRN